MSKAPTSIMDDLHGIVAKKLKERISGGSATAADFGAAIKFLKDNGIEADALNNPGVKSLAHEFPDFDEEEHKSRIN